MRLRGVEADSVTDSVSIDLQQSTNSGAAECGAVGPDSCQYDDRLQMIIDAWLSLPEQRKSQIFQMVQSECS